MANTRQINHTFEKGPANLQSPLNPKPSKRQWWEQGNDEMRDRGEIKIMQSAYADSQYISLI